MKKILNCLICGLLFGAFINHADCSNSKQTNSHTKIQDRHGYDKKGNMIYHQPIVGNTQETAIQKLQI